MEPTLSDKYQGKRLRREDWEKSSLPSSIASSPGSIPSSLPFDDVSEQGDFDLDEKDIQLQDDDEEGEEESDEEGEEESEGEEEQSDEEEDDEDSESSIEEDIEISPSVKKPPVVDQEKYVLLST